MGVDLLLPETVACVTFMFRPVQVSPGASMGFLVDDKPLVEPFPVPVVQSEYQFNGPFEKGSLLSLRLFSGSVGLVRISVLGEYDA